MKIDLMCRTDNGVLTRYAGRFDVNSDGMYTIFVTYWKGRVYWEAEVYSPSRELNFHIEHTEKEVVMQGLKEYIGDL